MAPRGCCACGFLGKGGNISSKPTSHDIPEIILPAGVGGDAAAGNPEWSQEVTRQLSKRSCRSSNISEVMQEHVKSRELQLSTQTFLPGEPLTKSNAKPDLLVVRGLDWKWGDEDGGMGQPGRILSVCKNTQTATVHWQATGLVESHYRFGTRKCDLCLTQGFRDATQSKMMAALSGFRRSSTRRNSQRTFADKAQTVIILDWDDTLFPSTFVRNDMHFSLDVPLREQNLPALVKAQALNSLKQCAANADRLLRLACSYGKVILVTLARRPWVSESCRMFYPGIAELLKNLAVKVVYAQEGMRIDYRKIDMMTTRQAESFWSAVKGRAIGTQIAQFYSQYEGQSWKNIISIGDSHFERLGTIMATTEYMREKGIEVPATFETTIQTGSGALEPTFQGSEASEVNVGNHTYHVRTKVLKMVDEPTIEELTIELSLVRQWLPLMVKRDAGFSVDLSSLSDWDEAQAIEAELQGRPRGFDPSSSEPLSLSSMSCSLELQPSATSEVGSSRQPSLAAPQTQV